MNILLAGSGSTGYSKFVCLFVFPGIPNRCAIIFGNMKIQHGHSALHVSVFSHSSARPKLKGLSVIVYSKLHFFSNTQIFLSLYFLFISLFGRKGQALLWIPKIFTSF